jgi:hypothetical protein
LYKLNHENFVGWYENFDIPEIDAFAEVIKHFGFKRIECYHSKKRFLLIQKKATLIGAVKNTIKRKVKRL